MSTELLEQATWEQRTKEVLAQVNARLAQQQAADSRQTAASAQHERQGPGLMPSVKAATGRGFHVFALMPKDKIPLPGSQGFKDSKPPSDPQV